MVIAAVIVFCYTFIGGYLSVCTTDLIQSILMCFALIVVFVGSVVSVGGVENVANALLDIPGYVSMTTSAVPLENGSFGIPESFGIIGIISAIS